MRLGSMSAHLDAEASRTAHIKEKAVWETVAGQAVVMSNFEPSFFGKGKSTDFRKVKSTP